MAASFGELTVINCNIQKDDAPHLPLGKVYFIPRYVLDNLLMKLGGHENSELRTLIFVERHIRLVSYIISHDQHQFKIIRKICGGVGGVGYRTHMKFLKGLIIQRGKYQVGSQSFSYKMNTDVSEWVFACITIDTMMEKIVQLDLEQSHPLQNPTFIETLKCATVDLNAAIHDEFKYCRRENLGNKRFVARLTKLFTFFYGEQRRVGKGEIVDRVYSSFTQLTKVSRKYVCIHERFFYEVDITNCQPLLFIAVLHSHSLPYDEQYKNDVFDGVFYQKLRQQAIADGIEHEYIYEPKLRQRIAYRIEEEVKMIVFRSVFFGKKNENQSPILKVFRRLYPTTYDSLIACRKANPDVSIAKLLQDLESKIILTIKLDEPYFHVHDAVYVLSESSVSLVRRQIQENFEKEIGEKFRALPFKVTEPPRESDRVIGRRTEIEKLTFCLRKKRKGKVRKF